MSTQTTTPQIYVACLAAYNNGELHGRWIDVLNNDPDQINAEVQLMLKLSPETFAEEWAIHDYEGFEGVSLSEWSGFERVHRLAQFIDVYGVLGAKLLDHCDNDVETAKTIMDENYRGCYRRLADFAEELTTDITDIPENLRFYIDYALMARDMELSGDIFTITTGWEEVHVFWSR